MGRVLREVALEQSFDAGRDVMCGDVSPTTGYPVKGRREGVVEVVGRALYFQIIPQTGSFIQRQEGIGLPTSLETETDLRQQFL